MKSSTFDLGLIQLIFLSNDLDLVRVIKWIQINYLDMTLYNMADWLNDRLACTNGVLNENNFMTTLCLALKYYCSQESLRWGRRCTSTKVEKYNEYSSCNCWVLLLFSNKNISRVLIGSELWTRCHIRLVIARIWTSHALKTHIRYCDVIWLNIETTYIYSYLCCTY
jgi:hypothetical protein